MTYKYKWIEDKADYSDKIIIRHNDYIFMWQTKGFSWSEIIYIGNLEWHERMQTIFNLVEHLSVSINYLASLFKTTIISK